MKTKNNTTSNRSVKNPHMKKISPINKGVKQPYTKKTIPVTAVVQQSYTKKTTPITTVDKKSNTKKNDGKKDKISFNKTYLSLFKGILRLILIVSLKIINKILLKLFFICFYYF